MRMDPSVVDDIKSWEAAKSSIYNSLASPFAMMAGTVLGTAMGFKPAASAFAAYNAFSAVNAASTQTDSERYGIGVSQPLVNLFAQQVYGKVPPVHYPTESLNPLGHDDTGPRASSAVVQALSGGSQQTRDNRRMLQSSYHNFVQHAMSPYAV